MNTKVELCSVGLWGLLLMLTVQACGAPDAEVQPFGSEPSPSDMEASLRARQEATGESCSIEGERLADGSYAKLSDTGLYCDIERDAINADALFYEPAFPLWSDGADKRRYLWLPPDTQIDTSDMDAWVFPVGTKVWKEFSLDGRKVETRLLEKVDGGTWLAMVFAWTNEGDEAYPAPNGASNVLGTTYDIPGTAQCMTCHAGSSDMPLGIAALQLGPGANPLGVNVWSLSLAGRLSDPPQKIARFPGRQADKQALGYLYANCSSCHGRRRSIGGLDLSTSVYDEAVTDTRAYQTTVNRLLRSWTGHGYETRIVPGAPEESGLLARMASREPGTQMPPLGSKVVDQKGLKQVRRWIRSLR